MLNAFDAGPQILFNLYQKGIQFLWPMASVCYMALAMIGEYCSFSSTLPCLEQLLPLLYLLEAGLCIFFIEADSLFSGSFIVVDFYDPSSAGLLSLYRFADRDNHRTDDGVEDLFFLDCTLRVFP